MNKTELQVIEDFVERVNKRAERNMEITHKLEGSHYAAMMYELEQMRLLVSDVAADAAYAKARERLRSSVLGW